MNESFGQQVKTLYNRLIVMPEKDRLLLLKNSQYPDAVKQQVASMLNYSGDIDEALAQTIADTAQQSLHVTAIEANQMIAQYRLIERIGTGGQGEVWLAERDDGEFNHQVAIKFLKISANEYELARFQTERELLASLQHPNIAGLIGGGQFNDRLYMIMEWIDGTPLLDYIENQTNIETTLALFLQVCDAVSHAHTQGIIHRDIKPSNILITQSGVVKLLDFGIAKPIDKENTHTQSAAMMTLAYSSPEQIKGQPVTTATDVYALGLLLYELLTTCKAQDSNTESPAEFLNIITDVTPEKPSVLASKTGCRFPARMLQGDLDNLVMMAIRKEPERRYNTVDALSNDIDNYLSSKPLLASGDSWSYKTTKLLKRNPLASALAFIVAVCLIVLPVLMYQHGQRLEYERDIAQEQTLVANKTAEFLTTLFESASPLGHQGQSIDLQSVLAQGERQLSAGLAGQPKVEAALAMIMAAIQHHMENTPKAIEYYQQAIDAFKQAGDQSGELTARGQLALMYFRADDLTKMDVAFAAAEQLATSVSEPNDLIWLQIRQATVANERGQRDEVIARINPLLSGLNDEQRQDPALMGRLYSELGEANKYKDHEKSLEYATLGMQYAEQEVGKIHPYYLRRINSKATRLMRMNRHEEAVEVLSQVEDIARKLYSEDHPLYAANLSGSAVFNHDKGHFEQAQSIYSKILKVYAKHYGNQNFEYARVINNLAYVYEDLRDYDQAERLYRESIDLRTQLDPDNRIRIATARANLARLLAKKHQHAQSYAILDEVIPVFAEHDRNNLYNEITRIANVFGDGSDLNNCLQGVEQLKLIQPEIEKESPKGWKRLGAEWWIGLIFKDCQMNTKAKLWLTTAQNKATQIYQPGASGLTMLDQDLSTLK